MLVCPCGKPAQRGDTFCSDACFGKSYQKRRCVLCFESMDMCDPRQVCDRCSKEKAAWLHLDGWEGRTKQAVLVVGDTPTQYRIKPIGDEPVKLAGRSRWLLPGNTVLVPKIAITFQQH